MGEKANYFAELNSVNVNGHTEKKNGLTYLSWPWAWGEIKKRHPEATYTVYENKDSLNYHSDGRTCWVKTGVTVEGIEHIEYLPVMDYRNQSIPLAKVTSMDVNKAIQRSLTKAAARHGLGLYIYAGEDFPEESGDEEREEKPRPAPEDTEIGRDGAARLERELSAAGVNIGRLCEMKGVDGLEKLTVSQANIIARQIEEHMKGGGK